MWALVARCLVGLHGYSGAGAGPMFGDFEAQRHWMEVTTCLPIGEWYHQSKRNDLQYWGLDYPPLTAYVSWVFGRGAWAVVPALVELGTSRGHESLEGKVYMRVTVLAADCLVLLPALLRCAAAMRANRMAALLAPALLLIDHGHFQVASPRLSALTLTLTPRLSVQTPSWPRAGYFPSAVFPVRLVYLIYLELTYLILSA